MTEEKKKSKGRIIARVIGPILIGVGLLLIILGCTVLTYTPFGDDFFGEQPNMGAIMPGAFMCFVGLALTVGSFAKMPENGIHGGVTFTIAPGGAAGTGVLQQQQPEEKSQKPTRCPGCGGPVTAQTGKFCDFCGTKL